MDGKMAGRKVGGKTEHWWWHLDTKGKYTDELRNISLSFIVKSSKMKTNNYILGS